ncbi:MAG: MarR family transcriptional regulator [Candidatus Omnitrophica bacterium]|nr:MarR family transcriptional regulator [Candidatus Omnitrophota bacterium]
MALALSEFADRLSSVFPVMAREFARHYMGDFYSEKITLPQFLVLEFLFLNGESKMKDLAHAMHVSTAGMTGIVDRIVRDGYVVRVFDPEDRRIIKIKLTPQGTGLVKRINAQRRKMVMDLFSKISEAERENYLRIVTKIKDELLKTYALNTHT